MKYFLASILVLNGLFTAYSQSKYDFQTGFDSTAFNHRIYSKSIYQIRIDSIKIDTTSLEERVFDTNGYLLAIEVTNRPNIKNRPRYFSNKKTAYFEYNQAGYLVNENVSWGDPKGWWGEDTVKKRKIEDWAYIKHTELLMSSETVNNYPDLAEWVEKCNYTYRSDNQTDSVVCFASMGDETNKLTTRYFYNYQGLLIEIQYQNMLGTYKRTLIEYEFYD